MAATDQTFHTRGQPAILAEGVGKRFGKVRALATPRHGRKLRRRRGCDCRDSQRPSRGRRGMNQL
jgi:hypothetical protein